MPEYTVPQFNVHVDAIVRRGDQILIMKRAMGVMSGAWYFPGGSLEEHESPEQGVRREIREETELVVDDLRLFRVWHYRANESTAAVSARSAQRGWRRIPWPEVRDDLRRK